jgi:hypothetical protein
MDNPVGITASGTLDQIALSGKRNVVLLIPHRITTYGAKLRFVALNHLLLCESQPFGKSLDLG